MSEKELKSLIIQLETTNREKDAKIKDLKEQRAVYNELFGGYGHNGCRLTIETLKKKLKKSA